MQEAEGESLNQQISVVAGSEEPCNGGVQERPGVPCMATHSDKGGDDNEDAPFMNESIDFFDLDWVPEQEHLQREVTVMEGVQVWGCGVALIYRS